MCGIAARPASGRAAVVTGGGSGVGLAVARRLARQGHPVGILDGDGTAAESAAEELRRDGAIAFARGVDVTDRAAVDDVLHVVREWIGPVLVLVTTAGELPCGDAAMAGTCNSLQPVIPDMVDALWGRIVALSSPAGSAVAARTRALADDLAPQRITVNAIPSAPDVAEVTAYLCTDAAGCITGRVIGAGRGQPTWGHRL